MAKQVHKSADVLAEIRQAIEDARIPGFARCAADTAMGYSVDAAWSLGWAIDASLHVKLAHGDGKARAVSVSVSWGSSTYSPARATACAALHRQIADLACLISAQGEGVIVEVSE